jgi:hypothetical protein
MSGKIFAPVLLLLVVFFVASLGFSDVPQMINYQGKITTPAGALIDTTIQMIFTIYDDSTSGSTLWADTLPSVVVEKGIFSVILGATVPIDDSVFKGDVRYLGVKVGSDPEMTPRKAIISVAYAYKALESDTADYARAAPGAGADNDWTFQITDTADTTLMTGGEWGIARYGNVLWGNADSTHVNLGVEGETGRQMQDLKYCTVGGGFGNRATGEYATASGGEGNTAAGWRSTVGGGQYNGATANHSTIAGGYSNTADANQATVGGGEGNWAMVQYATIAGGYGNTASGYQATVSGGGTNVASGHWATAGGGLRNRAYGEYATIAGGDSSKVEGIGSTVGGGVHHVIEGDYSAILGGYADTISTSADYSYLFGIKSKLSSDSTFMVDMPHIRFGDETNGYEFPTSDGSSGQVMATDGSGQLSWTNVSGGSGGWVDDGNVVRLQTSTDSVGIGTSSPGAPLQVGSGSHTPVFLNTEVQIDHDDASSHRMEIRNNNGATGWSIDASGTTTFGPISATKNLHLLGGNSVRMTIDGTSGDVGIGTTSPDAPLQVGSGTHAPVLVNTSVQIDHDDASEHNIEIRNNSGATGWRINASGATTFGPLSAGQDLYLLGGNSTRMTIDGTSGDVGIGTTNPQARLHIVPSSTHALTVQRDGEVHISMKAYGSSSYPIFNSLRGRGTSASPAAVQSGDELLIYQANGQYSASSSRTGGQLVFQANQNWSLSASGTRIVLDGVNDNSTSPSEWMRLVNGNVGIGTTSPTARLDVNSSTGYNQVRMRTSYTPTGTSDANGNVGDIAWDDSYIYIKTSAGWKRVALSTF